MTARDFLTQLTDRGVSLSVQDGKLSYRAPKGSLTDQDRESLALHKPALILLLSDPEPESVEEEVEAPRPALLSEADLFAMLDRGELRGRMVLLDGQEYDAHDTVDSYRRVLSYASHPKESEKRRKDAASLLPQARRHLQEIAAQMTPGYVPQIVSDPSPPPRLVLLDDTRIPCCVYCQAVATVCVEGISMLCDSCWEATQARRSEPEPELPPDPFGTPEEEAEEARLYAGAPRYWSQSWREDPDLQPLTGLLLAYERGELSKGYLRIRPDVEAANFHAFVDYSLSAYEEGDPDALKRLSICQEAWEQVRVAVVARLQEGDIDLPDSDFTV